MYEVVLRSFPKPRREHVERVVHKHNRALDHHGFEHLVAQVAAGRPQVVARCDEAEVAENVVRELAYHRAEAEVREKEA